MSIQKLRDERTVKAREYRNLLEQNPGTLSAEVVAKLDGLEAEISSLDVSIDKHEKALNMAATKVADEAVADALGKKSGKAAYDAVFNKWLRDGEKALTAEDMQIVRNTMSTTTGSQGGYAVPSEIAKSIIDALKAFGGMRDAATIIRTSSGASLNFPTSDGTAETGELLDQNIAATAADPTFNTVPLPVYKFSSKSVAVPIELLQDADVDIESFIRMRLATRLGRITNTYFTTGTGTNQPSGIVTGLSAGKTGTTGQTTSVIYDDLVDLEHSVDPAYRKLGCKWMMHDTSLKVIKKLKDSQNRPLWMPDVAKGAPATILDYEYIINQDVAQMAANAKSILFGKLDAYTIRDAMDIQMFRFEDSGFMLKGQIGFLALMRSGGVNTDTSAIKYYANSAT